MSQQGRPFCSHDSIPSPYRTLDTVQCSCFGIPWSPGEVLGSLTIMPCVSLFLPLLTDFASCVDVVGSMPVWKHCVFMDSCPLYGDMKSHFVPDNLPRCEFCFSKISMDTCSFYWCWQLVSLSIPLCLSYHVLTGELLDLSILFSLPVGWSMEGTP